MTWSLHQDFCDSGRVHSICMRGTVLLNLSAWPFPYGWYGVVWLQMAPQYFSKQWNSLFLNSRPWSWWIQWGIPKQGIKSLNSFSAAVRADLVLVQFAWVYHVKSSTTRRIYSDLPLVGSRCRKSIDISSNGAEEVCWYKGALLARLSFFCFKQLQPLLP